VPQVFRFLNSAFSAIGLAIVLASAAPVGALIAQGTGQLTGVVRDSAGRPIRDAELVVAGRAGSARTNDAGEFRVGAVPVGERRVVLRRLGYVPADTTIRIAADSTTRVSIVMIAQPALLDTVRVAAACPQLGFEGFRCRKQVGRGVYLDLDSIDAAYAGYEGTGDLFRDRPGFQMRVTPRGVRRPVATGGWGCLIEVVDGRLASRTNPVPYTLKQVIGVEIYQKLSDVPPYYQQYAWQRAYPCTLVVYWTQVRPRR
jgi:hypothetical protein